MKYGGGRLLRPFYQQRATGSVSTSLGEIVFCIGFSNLSIQWYCKNRGWELGFLCCQIYTIISPETMPPCFSGTYPGKQNRPTSRRPKQSSCNLCNFFLGYQPRECGNWQPGSSCCQKLRHRPERPIRARDRGVAFSPSCIPCSEYSVESDVSGFRCTP